MLVSKHSFVVVVPDLCKYLDIYAKHKSSLTSPVTRFWDSREVGHRVKSISASKFSGAEVVALQQGGNQVARAIWLSNYGKDNVDPETDDEVRAFIRQKYCK